MKLRIIVLDANHKVWNLVGRAAQNLPDYKVEGCLFIKDVNDRLADEHRFDIRLIIVGDATDTEKPEVRKWGQELYMQGYTLVWLSKTPPPLAEIRHVFKTEPIDQALEDTLKMWILRALFVK